MRRHTPRIPDFNYQGTYRYFWTICTRSRRREFDDAAVVSTVTSQFLRASQDHHVAVLAYCFMPDHVHLLIEGRDGHSSAVAFVSGAKQRSGYWFARRTGRPLWQRTSWDRVLRSDEDMWTVIRYILANPVRAGIVRHPLDYPHSGSFVYSREELMDAFDRDPAG